MTLCPSQRIASQRSCYSPTKAGTLVIKSVFVLQAGGRPVLQTHTERQSTGRQNVLDLGKRLLTQVWCFQQLHFSALDQITNVVNILSFQTVGRANRQLQIVHRTQQNWVNCLFLLLGRRLSIGLQVHKHSQLLLQNGGGAADRLFRIHGTVGLEVQNQLIQIGALTDPCALYRVRQTTNRAERRIKTQAPDGASLVLVVTATVRRLIATSASNGQAHIDFGFAGNVSDNQLRVFDFDIVIELNIARGDRKSTRLNFSHVAISYAVFCLKTKNYITLDQYSEHG